MSDTQQPTLCKNERCSNPATERGGLCRPCSDFEAEMKAEGEQILFEEKQMHKAWNREWDHRWFDFEED